MQTTPGFQGAFSTSMSKATILAIKLTFYPEPLQSQPGAEPTITQVDFPPEQTQQQRSYLEAIDADELSRTAGLLVDAVKEETNPKFQNSAFLGLMRQLRDKEMIVDGTNVVKARSSSTDVTSSSTWAQDFTTLPDVKGKGKARAESGWPNTSQDTARKSVHFGRSEFLVGGLDLERTEDADDRYWKQENEEYQEY